MNSVSESFKDLYAYVSYKLAPHDLDYGEGDPDYDLSLVDINLNEPEPYETETFRTTDEDFLQYD